MDAGVMKGDLSFVETQCEIKDLSVCCSYRILYRAFSADFLLYSSLGLKPQAIFNRRFTAEALLNDPKCLLSSSFDIRMSPKGAEDYSLGFQPQEYLFAVCPVNSSRRNRSAIGGSAMGSVP